MAPAKEHFLRAPGVRAVHVLGSRVYLVLEDGLSLEKLLAQSRVEDFYNVRVESAEAVASVEEALERIKRADRLKLVV
ncbi:hypothetical protein IG193_01230 [Infirmifilum lucidum]|uniref:Uncharacterized protein n=1 Tax=Infirmifilum lucidum TaxID=2776706 RepID=A0A7L9FH11_9CREN|nr:hypothetical protein [Infirmifilum lucidum]QOJ79118.1 hypothetical protein IG193_01230 [Infirmifilum lucidum]